MKTLYFTPSDNLSEKINAQTEPCVVRLSAGVYKQKIEIRANGITVIGEGENTVITYDDYATKIHADGKEYNTFRTYTLCVSGEGVKLYNLTVENSNKDPISAGQCVALSVNAKSFYAKGVTLKSMQDTLFLAPFPDDLVVRYRGFIPENQLYMEGCSLHLFEDCKIMGTVDFIFGGAEAYFRNCEIISLYEKRGTAFVCAPCHALVQSQGFHFVKCNFVSRGAEDNSVYLARPWRDFGKCVFAGCNLGKHIRPELFDKWNDTYRDTTARFSFCGLKAGQKLAPVSWSHEIESIDDIINDCNGHFKDINDEN